MKELEQQMQELVTDFLEEVIDGNALISGLTEIKIKRDAIFAEMEEVTVKSAHVTKEQYDSFQSWMQRQFRFEGGFIYRNNDEWAENAIDRFLDSLNE